jgi:hypothetical protein
METTFDFADLEAEVYDWQDDMIVLAEDVNEQFFQDYINSNYDF